MAGVLDQHALQLAEKHFRAGRFADAERMCEQILARQADNPAALNLLAISVRQQGRICDAIEIASRAANAHPKIAEFHGNLGEFLRVAGELDRSVASFQRAIDLKPAEATFHNSLAMAYTDQRRHELAAAEFGRAIQLKPDYASAHNNLGGMLRELGRLDEAAAEIETAIRLQPRVANAYYNLAIVQTDQMRFSEATESYCRAIAVQPDYADAHWSLGTLCLLRGQMERGWREFQWRPSRAAQFSSPIWKGEGIAGRTILFYAEQGLGDTIQFVRYLPMLRERGANVWLACQPELYGILGDFAQLLRHGQAIPRHDFQCPLLDLAMVVPDAPAQPPYLKADSASSQKWWQRLGARKGKPRVGLVWAGRPEHREDARRSVRLENLTPILNVPDIEFFSLQKGPAAGQAAGFPITDLSSELQDFSDTAAIIEQLDLIVTVDTAVAHLAGAMGKAAWVLLAQVPDWRWMLEREDSPWYPTLRMFRQSRRGDWSEPIARVAMEIAKLR